MRHRERGETNSRKVRNDSRIAPLRLGIPRLASTAEVIPEADADAAPDQAPQSHPQANTPRSRQRRSAIRFDGDLSGGDFLRGDLVQRVRDWLRFTTEQRDQG